MNEIIFIIFGVIPDIMAPRENNERLSRREVLQTTGAGITTTGLYSASSAVDGDDYVEIPCVKGRNGVKRYK